MRRRVAIGSVLAVMGTLMWTGVADAHTLSKERAYKASLKGVKGHCENDPYCDDYGVKRCRRPSGSGHRRLHRMRCDVFLRGTDKTGDWICSWTDQWSSKPGRKRLRWSEEVYNKTFECTRP